jgi:hypothetical protein
MKLLRTGARLGVFAVSVFLISVAGLGLGAVFALGDVGAVQVDGGGFATAAAGDLAEQTSASHDFLRPVKPDDHREAGELWVMPSVDGRLRISPLRQWSQTGLELRVGQQLEIHAGGYVQGCQRPVGDWAYGPWGPAGGPAKDEPGARVCALIGRIVGDRETAEFVVGERFRGRVPLAGRLLLGVSDVWHFDNSGEFVVTIKVDGEQVDFTQHQAAAAATANLVPTMRPMNAVEVSQLDGARRMESRRDADRPMLATQQQFRPPLEIRARARTDSANIRLYYGCFGLGTLIFNWEVRPDQLRVHDPATGTITGVPGAGGLARDEFHDIVWRIGARRMQVLVDGEERFRCVGDYGSVVSPVGIGPAWGSRVDVASVVVLPLDPAAMDGPARR